MSSMLSREDILRLMRLKPPLIEGLLSADDQLQPNGVDLTLRRLDMLQGGGVVGVDNSKRRLPDAVPLTFDGMGFIDLVPGIYLMTFNELVHMPKDVAALATPRSSLLRCGVTVNTAVWDAGYEGRSQALMVVYNPHGFRLERNARVIQMVFLRLTGETKGYGGVYQGENMG